jgi:hypothetical protein
MPNRATADRELHVATFPNLAPRGKDFEERFAAVARKTYPEM